MKVSVKGDNKGALFGALLFWLVVVVGLALWKESHSQSQGFTPLVEAAIVDETGNRHMMVGDLTSMTYKNIGGQIVLCISVQRAVGLPVIPLQNQIFKSTFDGTTGFCFNG